METILATSPTCGPCKQIKQYIEDRFGKTHPFIFKCVSEDIEFFREHGIRSVPVLILKNDKGEVFRRYDGSQEIMNYFTEE